MTDKGSEFKEKLLERTYRGAIREWRKQLNKVRNTIADSDESEILRNERSFLETRFDIIVSSFERFYEFLETNKESRVDEVIHEFNDVDKENSDVLKVVNERITEIRKSVENLERFRLPESCNERIRLESSREQSVKPLNENVSHLMLHADLPPQTNPVTSLPVTPISVTQRTVTPLPVTQANKVGPYVTPSTHQTVTVNNNLVTQTPSNKRVTVSQFEGKTATPSSNPFKPNVISSTNPFVLSTPARSTFDRLHILDSPLEFSTIAPEPLIPMSSSYANPYISMQPPGPGSLSNEFDRNIFSMETQQPNLQHSVYPQRNLSGSSFPPVHTETSPAKGSQEDTLAKLADLLIERRIRDSLPLPEPDVFRGDLLHYPSWLKSFETIVEGQVKKASSHKIETKERFDLEHRVRRFSSWHKAKKAIAACMKVQRKFKEKSTPASSSASIDVAALHRAEREIVKDVQARHFTDEITSLRNNIKVKVGSAILPLDPFLDQDGILRVGGRLTNANTLEYEARHPAILPKKGHVTDLVIRHFHERTSHQGRGRTLAEVRSSGFWIAGGRSAVGHYITRCVTCKRLRGAPQSQKMADLPEDRLGETAPFTYSAVDYFGPFIVKEGRKELKRYGVLFTCLSSRAIHIETAASLTTDSFISAYRRFIGRRGPARQLRSDQGTNFVGAKNEMQSALSEFNHAKISDDLRQDNCDWVHVKMNVPHASHMGGVWERQIRTVRSVLSALLLQHGSQLDDESLRTLMVEAEAIVNSRPLTIEDLSTPDQAVLSPNMLLTQKTSVVLPPPGRFEDPDLYSRKRWRRVQYLANQFWSSWKKHYLQSLQHRQKWLQPKLNLEEGDIILLKEEDVPRNQWRLGRIASAIPSDDGLVRKVRIFTGKEKKVYERPITKVVLLVKKKDT